MRPLTLIGNFVLVVLVALSVVACESGAKNDSCGGCPEGQICSAALGQCVSQCAPQCQGRRTEVAGAIVDEDETDALGRLGELGGGCHGRSC